MNKEHSLQRRAADNGGNELYRLNQTSLSEANEVYRHLEAIEREAQHLAEIEAIEEIEAQHADTIGRAT